MSQLKRCATATPLEARMIHYAPDGSGTTLGDWARQGLLRHAAKRRHLEGDPNSMRETGNRHIRPQAPTQAAQPNDGSEIPTLSERRIREGQLRYVWPILRWLARMREDSPPRHRSSKSARTSSHRCATTSQYPRSLSSTFSALRRPLRHSRLRATCATLSLPRARSSWSGDWTLRSTPRTPTRTCELCRRPFTVRGELISEFDWEWIEY